MPPTSCDDDRDTPPAAAGRPPAPGPRMLECAVVAALLLWVTLLLQDIAPHGALAVSAYKAHLIALGGLAGYWLDRALFPYARPHLHLLADDEPEPAPPSRLHAAAFDQLEAQQQERGGFVELQVVSSQFSQSMMRRAVVVAACVLCAAFGG